MTHRLLRDHPEKITRGATLDIVPTLYRFETIDQKAATGSWHWFFLIQGRGLPEQMIGGDPEFFLRHMFGTLLHDEAAIEPAAWTEYLRCFRHPETIRATCDEYRAGASIDLVHDRADLSRKVRVPISGAVGDPPRICASMSRSVILSVRGAISPAMNGRSAQALRPKAENADRSTSLPLSSRASFKRRLEPHARLAPRSPRRVRPSTGRSGYA